MALQRPLTRKEFVIQSLLAWREPWATLVDAGETEDPTRPMRRPEVETPRPRSDSQDSAVFDLTVIPA